MVVYQIYELEYLLVLHMNRCQSSVKIRHPRISNTIICKNMGFVKVGLRILSYLCYDWDEILT